MYFHTNEGTTTDPARGACRSTTTGSTAPRFPPLHISLVPGPIAGAAGPAPVFLRWPVALSSRMLRRIVFSQNDAKHIHCETQWQKGECHPGRLGRNARTIPCLHLDMWTCAVVHLIPSTNRAASVRVDWRIGRHLGMPLAARRKPRRAAAQPLCAEASRRRCRRLLPPSRRRAAS